MYNLKNLQNFHFNYIVVYTIYSYILSLFYMCSLCTLTATAGNDITIIGTNFDTVASNHNITIGGVECVPKSSTTTRIICTVGSGPAGSYPIEIILASKGCTHNANGNVTFTYPFQLSSVSPLSSNLGGISEF